MEMVIDYGGEVDLTGTFSPPVALAESTVADVRRVVIYTGEMSTSKIKKLARTPEKFDFLSNEDWNNLADKDW